MGRRPRGLERARGAGQARPRAADDPPARGERAHQAGQIRPCPRADRHGDRGAAGQAEADFAGRAGDEGREIGSMDFDPATLRSGLIFFFLIASSICLRAYAQAWVANRLGDRTPADEGRLTANPLPHIDLLGTIVLPLIFIFYLQPTLSRQQLSLFLGWAKPVPINPRNFRNPRRDAVLTQFAGFGMGVLLLIVGALAGGALLRYLGYISEETYLNISRWSGLVIIILINLKPVMVLFAIVKSVLMLPFYLLMQAVATL